VFRRNCGGYDDAAVEGAFSPTDNDEGDGDAGTTPHFPRRRRRMVRMIPRRPLRGQCWRGRQSRRWWRSRSLASNTLPVPRPPNRNEMLPRRRWNSDGATAGGRANRTRCRTTRIVSRSRGGTAGMSMSATGVRMLRMLRGEAPGGIPVDSLAGVEGTTWTTCCTDSTSCCCLLRIHPRHHRHRRWDILSVFRLLTAVVT
jgi:hypothetical protein